MSVAMVEKKNEKAEEGRKCYLANAFSINMLEFFPSLVSIKEIDLETAVKTLKEREFINAISHEGTAKLLSELLRMEIKQNRINVKLRGEDCLIVFQLKERLPEGKVLSYEEIKNIKYSFYFIYVV